LLIRLPEGECEAASGQAFFRKWQRHVQARQTDCQSDCQSAAG
jgi:hypothetical protein